MLKDFVSRKYKTTIDYELAFDDGHGNGFAFPCDVSGRIFDDLYDEAKENYKRCMEHPERFKRWNKLVTIRRQICEPAHGRCICGREVELWDEYYGACKCDCGRWYNMFGQELMPPEHWEHDPSEEEYY